jgi:hypothetical protein
MTRNFAEWKVGHSRELQRTRGELGALGQELDEQWVEQQQQQGGLNGRIQAWAAEHDMELLLPEKPHGFEQIPEPRSPAGLQVKSTGLAHTLGQL